MRVLAQGSLLLAVVGVTGAYAGNVAPFGADTPLEAAAAGEDVRSAPLAYQQAASRSSVRVPDPHALALRVDGTTRSVFTRADTVAEMLAERGVVLGHDDEVNVPLDAEPQAVEEVVVSRVTFADVNEATEIPFGTREEADPSLLSGHRVVVAEGKPGTETTLYRVRLVNGVEEHREALLRSSIPPEDRVVRVGTRVPPPPPAPAPAAAAAPAPRAAYSGADPRSIARSMVAARGWGASQFTCLDRLWMKESNWNPYARNPSSGAYGIPQSLPASKMASAGGDWRTNPATQISWGLSYIAARYGTPCSAWAHSQAVNWY